MHSSAPPAEEPAFPADPALDDLDLPAQAAVFEQSADTGAPLCEA